MLKIIFLAISLCVIFKILQKRKNNQPTEAIDLSKEIASWKYDAAKGIKPKPLYSSRHKSTPNDEKAAEEIVTKHEKITRESMRSEKLE